MKKFIFSAFTAIGMIAAESSQEALAQNLSISGEAGPSLYAGGAASLHDYKYGLTARANFANNILFLGTNMNGGGIYLIEESFAEDSFRLQKVNAPALELVGGICIPEKKSPHFFGPIMGVGYGMSFPSHMRGSVNVMEVFMQGNYGGPVGSNRLSGFVKVSTSFLYLEQTVPSWCVSLGITFTIPNVLFSISDDEEY